MKKLILAAAAVAASAFGPAFAQGNYSTPTQANADYRGQAVQAAPRAFVTAPISLDLGRGSASGVDRQAVPDSATNHPGN